MTDRHVGYIVTLDQDIREDDAQPILDALKMMKHVVDVQPVIGEGWAAAAADMRIRNKVGLELFEMGRKLMDSKA